MLRRCVKVILVTVDDVLMGFVGHHGEVVGGQRRRIRVLTGRMGIEKDGRWPWSGGQSGHGDCRRILAPMWKRVVAHFYYSSSCFFLLRKGLVKAKKYTLKENKLKNFKPFPHCRHPWRSGRWRERFGSGPGRDHCQGAWCWWRPDGGRWGLQWRLVPPETLLATQREMLRCCSGGMPSLSWILASTLPLLSEDSMPKVMTFPKGFHDYLRRSC